MLRIKHKNDFEADYVNIGFNCREDKVYIEMGSSDSFDETYMYLTRENAMEMIDLIRRAIDDLDDRKN